MDWAAQGGIKFESRPEIPNLRYAGNTADCSTLRDFLKKIETTYGKARRVWFMDRGIPTEAVLEQADVITRPPLHLQMDQIVYGDVMVAHHSYRDNSSS